MSTVTWEPTTEIQEISEQWELCSQVADTASSQVEQSQDDAFILEYFFISLPQNEGSRVHSVKLQKIARMCNSFPENQLP